MTPYTDLNNKLNATIAGHINDRFPTLMKDKDPLRKEILVNELTAHAHTAGAIAAKAILPTSINGTMAGPDYVKAVIPKAVDAATEVYKRRLAGMDERQIQRELHAILPASYSAPGASNAATIMNEIAMKTGQISDKPGSYDAISVMSHVAEKTKTV